MKDIGKEVDEHNRRVLEQKEEMESQRKREEKFAALYCKNLPKDRESLGAMARVNWRGARMGIWDLGRICIAVRIGMKHGEWGRWLEDFGIPPRTATRAINLVLNIPDAELKALSRNPAHAYELPGPMTEEEEELAERIESDDCSPADFARRSPTDVKKLLAKIEKLEQENREHATRNTELQAQVDAIKLGTIDEQKIREWVAKWQVDWLGGRNRVLKLLQECSEASQMDVFAALQWFGHELLLLEIEIAGRFPAFDTYGGPDRGALANWMEEHGRAGAESPLMAATPVVGCGESDISDASDNSDGGRPNVKLAWGCKHFRCQPGTEFCTHVTGPCEEKLCCKNCGNTDNCNARCAYADEPEEEANRKGAKGAEESQRKSTAKGTKRNKGKGNRR